jgi:hypothetical protein
VLKAGFGPVGLIRSEVWGVMAAASSRHAVLLVGEYRAVRLEHAVLKLVALDVSIIQTPLSKIH